MPQAVNYNYSSTTDDFPDFDLRDRTSTENASGNLQRSVSVITSSSTSSVSSSNSPIPTTPSYKDLVTEQAKGAEKAHTVILRGMWNGLKEAFTGNLITPVGLGAGAITTGLTVTVGATIGTGGIVGIALLIIFGSYVAYKAIEGAMNEWEKAYHPERSEERAAADKAAFKEELRQIPKQHEAAVENRLAKTREQIAADETYEAEFGSQSSSTYVQPIGGKEANYASREIVLTPAEQAALQTNRDDEIYNY